MKANLARAVLVAASLGLATSAAAQGYRFVVVTHGQASDPFWSVVKNGVDEAAKVYLRDPDLALDQLRSVIDLPAIKSFIMSRGFSEGPWGDNDEALWQEVVLTDGRRLIIWRADDETSTVVRSTSVFEPTGSPVATCSSTTPTRIRRCRWVSWISTVCRAIVARAGAVPNPLSGQELGRDGPAEEAAPLGERQRLAATLGEPEPLHPRQRRCIEGPLDARD